MRTVVWVVRVSHPSHARDARRHKSRNKSDAAKWTKTPRAPYQSPHVRSVAMAESIHATPIGGQPTGSLLVHMLVRFHYNTRNRTNEE